MPASWSDGDVNRDPGPVNRLEVGKPGEPVAIAEVVRLAAAGLAALGWAVIPSTTVDLIGTAAAAVVSIVATVLARRRVTPVR